MTEFILREGVLNDNYLQIADSDKVFKGGYISKVVEYVFASAWSDHKNVKRFRSIKQLRKYLLKNYTETELEHVCL